jgi:hypothetical protein
VHDWEQHDPLRHVRHQHPRRQPASGPPQARAQPIGVAVPASESAEALLFGAATEEKANLYNNGTLKLCFVHPLKRPPLRASDHCALSRMYIVNYLRQNQGLQDNFF